MKNLIAMIVAALFTINNVNAQCPDFVSTFGGSCIGIGWLGDAPDPLPSSFFIGEVRYNLVNGLQIPGFAGGYTPTGTNTCNILNPALFTGQIVFGETVCNYSGGILPVVLTQFSVRQEGQQAIVDWQTAFELNNREFILERSSDLKSWESIATVPGRLSSDAVVNYTYEDEFPHDGANYYRLKQIDMDGAFEYSELRYIDFSAKGPIYPNPATDYVSIRGQFVVYNSTGQIMAQGMNMQVDVSDWSPGLYFVTTANANHKLIVH